MRFETGAQLAMIYYLLSAVGTLLKGIVKWVAWRLKEDAGYKASQINQYKFEKWLERNSK